MIVYSDGTWVTGDADGITPDTATYIPDNSVFAAEVLKYRRVTVEKDQNGEVTSISEIPDEADETAAILAQLAETDSKVIRPLRAIAAGTATDEDRTRLAELEAQAEELRTVLKALNEINA